MTTIITIITVCLVLLALAVVIGFIVFTAYSLQLFVNLIRLKNWRKTLSFGNKVLLIDRARFEIVKIQFVSKNYCQVRSDYGNITKHHISRIYPLPWADR